MTGVTVQQAKCECCPAVAEVRVSYNMSGKGTKPFVVGLAAGIFGRNLASLRVWKLTKHFR